MRKTTAAIDGMRSTQKDENGPGDVTQGLKSVRENSCILISSQEVETFENKTGELASLCDVASQQVSAEIQFSPRH